jgi:predicted histidine transporter YuiF (NhaC family)
LLFTGTIKWNSSDTIISEGFKIMAGIGIVIIVESVQRIFETTVKNIDDFFSGKEIKYIV